MILLGGRVIDGTGRAPIDDGAVSIEGSRITAVGKRSDFGEDPGDSVIDCEGSTLIPGLFNCHCHLALDGDEESYTTKLPRLAQMKDPELVPIYMDQARRNLDAGVTTLRDLHPGPGGTPDAFLILQELIERGYADGSRILLALRPLVVAGGHGTQWLSRPVSGSEELRLAVRENIAHGSNVIKMMTAHSWGRLPNRPESWRRYFTPEELRVAAETAHMANIPISAHSHGADIIEANVEAGFDSIEHGSDLKDRTVELMAERGTYLVPTLSSFHNFTEVADGFGIPADRVDEARFVVKRQREGFGRALQAGVKIAAGNDAGFQFLPHGDSIVRELELYVELGMKPVEAIRSATMHAAGLLRVDDKLGSLEAGKLADVVVVRGDAEHDIGALRDVQLVIKEGRVVRDFRQEGPAQDGG